MKHLLVCINYYVTNTLDDSIYKQISFSKALGL